MQVLEITMNHRSIVCLVALCLFVSLRLSGDEKPPTVLFLIGEQEYHTSETLPQFARIHLEPKGIRCVYATAGELDPNRFDGLEALPQADLLVVSVRRRTPSVEQMDLIKTHISQGKPLIGIRTASHAFDRAPPDNHHVRWAEFDREILGMDYENHYGNKPPEDPPTKIWIEKSVEDHPLLQGVEAQFESTSHLYKNRRPDPKTVILILGQVVGREEIEPVAWTYKSKSCPVFYTSLGTPDDFKNRSFVQLLSNAVFHMLKNEQESSRTNQSQPK